MRPRSHTIRCVGRGRYPGLWRLRAEQLQRRRLFSYSYWLWAAAFPFGVVAAIVFFAKTVSANGRARRFKEAVSNDDEAVQLAQQRLADARALQDRVHALAGRMRSAADDADLEAAASQLARLERELDSELA